MTFYVLENLDKKNVVLKAGERLGSLLFASLNHNFA